MRVLCDTARTATTQLLQNECIFYRQQLLFCFHSSGHNGRAIERNSWAFGDLAGCVWSPPATQKTCSDTPDPVSECVNHECTCRMHAESCPYLSAGEKGGKGSWCFVFSHQFCIRKAWPGSLWTVNGSLSFWRQKETQERILTKVTVTEDLCACNSPSCCPRGFYTRADMHQSEQTHGG